MKKQLGIALLILLATVGFFGVVSAQPVQAHMEGGHMCDMCGHMGEHNHGHSDHHHCCCCHMMGHH